MNDLKHLSDDLEEWLAHPMTVRLKALVEGIVSHREASMCQSWLAGNPPSEADRQGFHEARKKWEDFFNSSPEDILAGEQFLKENEVEE